MKEISPMEAINELTTTIESTLSDDVIRLVNAISIASMEDDDVLQGHVNDIMAKMKLQIDWSSR